MKGKAYRKAERVTWREIRNAGKDGENYDYDKWYNNKPPLSPEQIAQKKQNKLVLRGSLIIIGWIGIMILLSMLT